MASKTDFQRHVLSVLGLPFDVITADDAEAQVLAAMHQGRSCFVSTPNLNFLATSYADPAFRDSVLISDLSLADGKSIILMARLLGHKLPERVAGADLFERLLKHPASGLRAYLLGGPDGVAKQAADCINTDHRANGARAVGWHCPGFGTVQQMSTPELIDDINAAEPNFVLVALGAQKGQAWIRHNLQAIRPCVISHLGAVINFTAGTVHRAPHLIQASGLEWAWRIKEEPRLWRRYFHDGLSVAQALATGMLFRALRRPQSTRHEGATIQLVSPPHDNTCHIHLAGPWGLANVARLRNGFAEATATSRAIVVNMAGLTSLDAYALGTLQLLYGEQLRQRQPFRLAAVPPAISRLLKAQRCAYLETVLGTSPSSLPPERAKA